MMFKLTITVSFAIYLMLCVNSYAQSVQGDKTDICHYILSHKPDEDVMYRPGVDVEGNPVEPAELNNTHIIPAPKVIEFPLTIELDKYLKTTGVTKNLELKTNLETLKVDMDTGIVTYDNQELTTVLQDYCHESMHPIKSGLKPKKTGPKPPKAKPGHQNQ